MYQRIIISVVLFAVFFASKATDIGYADFSATLFHFIYPFFHANIFHLLGNVLCLWLFRCQLHISAGYLIAVLCSFLPTLVSEPTVGFSGVLFAVAGISWGNIGKFTLMCKKCAPFLLITLFIPHINALIHVYCLLAGYLYGLLNIKDPLSNYDSYKQPLCFQR